MIENTVLKAVHISHSTPNLCAQKQFVQTLLFVFMLVFSHLTVVVIVSIIYCIV